MKNKSLKKPITVVQGLSFTEMIQQSMERQEKDYDYVLRTGKCCACKKRKAVSDGRCQTCTDKGNEALAALKKTPGFMQFSIKRAS